MPLLQSPLQLRAGSLGGPGFAWEARVLAAVANWSCVCRLPGSSDLGGTSSSDPRGLAPGEVGVPLPGRSELTGVLGVGQGWRRTKEET